MVQFKRFHCSKRRYVFKAISFCLSKMMNNFTTTNTLGGVGSSIGNAYYLKNAKAILIEITSDLAADAYFHPTTDLTFWSHLNI